MEYTRPSTHHRTNLFFAPIGFLIISLPHILITFHPFSFSFLLTILSLFIFSEIFFSQNADTVLLHLPKCLPYQNSPSTNTAILWLGTATSGLPFTDNVFRSRCSKNLQCEIMQFQVLYSL